MKEKALKITVFVLAALLALNFALTIVLFVKNDNLSTTLYENQNALSEMMHEPSDKYAGHPFRIENEYQGEIVTITEISEHLLRISYEYSRIESETKYYVCEVDKADVTIAFVGHNGYYNYVPYKDLE